MNCPNCGAPLVNGMCEYCGTIANEKIYIILEALNSEFEIAQFELALSKQSSLITNGIRY